MSTQQIPTVAQLHAARKIVWHQDVSASAESAPVEAEEPAAAEDGRIEEISASAAVLEPEASEAEAGPGDGEASDEAEGPGDGEAAGSKAAAVAAAASAAVVTLEAARGLLERAGLMAFAPHPALAGAPGPSLVEATLGRAVAAPTLAEGTVARSLLARMVAEGSAVPLNLLGAQGTTGEAPDFVVSAAAFPYVFTLRGDKGWKQLPETTGANKVSPLAVNTYALLVEGGPQTAYALTGELGKGLTEAAVTRALGELWQLLRVIPVAQAGGKATVWEPVTTRLTRQVKAGANAGQPTALSALISLYLGQALLATEDEIEVFLSTVAPRSRVRDVVHALMAAGELETMAVAGKQHLYLPGELPVFGEGGAAAESPRAMRESGPRLEDEGPRMRRMVKDARPGGDRAKPFRGAAERGGKGFGGARPAFRREGGPGPGGFGPRREGGPGAPREGGERPQRFDRPWEEGKRPPRPGFGRDADGPRPPREGFAGKPGFGGRPGRPGGDRPAFGRPRPSGGAPFAGGPPRADRPFAPRDRGGDRPFAPRDRGAEGGGAGDREQRRPFRREGGEEFRGPRPGGDRPGSRFGAGDRGPRPGGGEGRPSFRRFDAPREGGPPRPPRDRGDQAGGFRPRPGGFAPREGGDRPAGRGFAPRAGADRPAGRGFPPREGGDRPGGRGFGPRPGGDRPAGRGFGPRSGAGEGRPFRPAGGGGGARFGSGGRAGGEGKRPFAKRGEAPGAGPFDKFRDGNKPWGKRPPARKIKPEEGEG